MKFYRILDSFSIAERWYLGAPKTRSGLEIDPRLFTEGKEYRGETPLEIPVRRGKTVLDFTLGSFDMPVVTELVASHLATLCGGSIQHIPALIRGRDLRVEIMNALTIVEAINEEQSEITRWTEKDGQPLKIGKYFGIGRLVLKRGRLHGLKIFRLKNWELPLIICESVRAHLEGLRTTGIAFQELEAM